MGFSPSLYTLFHIHYSTEEDLAKVRDRCACGKDALLVANYGGVTAVTTDPLYCLMYPTVYNEGLEDQTHFNTVASPSGMHTHVCMCHSLQLVNKDPKNRRTYEGSRLIVPSGAQYQNLFPEITTPHDHWGLLLDPNTGSPTPWWQQESSALRTPSSRQSQGQPSVQ